MLHLNHQNCLTIGIFCQRQHHGALYILLRREKQTKRPKSSTLLSPFYFVALLDSSQPDFGTLSDETMMQSLGGAKYKKGSRMQSQSGTFASCNFPDCTSGTVTYRPAIYACDPCYSGDRQAVKVQAYRKITSWCDSTLDTECPYGSKPHGKKRDDCETSSGSTC